MIPLEVNDTFIDRTKSAMYLYYLTNAYLRSERRDLTKKKVQITLGKLKKLGTKAVQRHLDELESHVGIALGQTSMLSTHQREEDKFHTALKHRINALEDKFGKYLSSQEARKARIKELEEKIKHRFHTKKEQIAHLKKDYSRIFKLYLDAKRGASEEQREKLNQRLELIRAKIIALQ